MKTIKITLAVLFSTIMLLGTATSSVSAATATKPIEESKWFIWWR